MGSQVAKLTCLQLVSLRSSPMEDISHVRSKNATHMAKLLPFAISHPRSPPHPCSHAGFPSSKQVVKCQEYLPWGSTIHLERSASIQGTDNQVRHTGPLMPACKCATTHETSCLRPRMQKSLRRPPIADAQSGDSMYQRLVIGDNAGTGPSSNNHNVTSRIRGLLAWSFMPSFIL
jgi:hypothetical protein